LTAIVDAHGADDVRPQLDRLTRYKLVRGVRMQLHGHENPLYRFATRRRCRTRPALRVYRLPP
jgi:predicted TIM-barrel fold metal-dependent hydrolase